MRPLGWLSLHDCSQEKHTQATRGNSKKVALWMQAKDAVQEVSGETIPTDILIMDA